MSRSVNAFETPPLLSMMRSYSLGGTFFEPLNIMCSKKCEIPVMPGPSLREPTRYHCQKVTAGTLWSSWRRMTRPFGSVCRATGKRVGLSGLAEGGVAAAAVAVPELGFDLAFAASAGALAARIATAIHAAALIGFMCSPRALRRVAVYRR